MGFFDGSSDDEEQQQDNQKLKESKEDTQDEEEDPLDAYMKSLQQLEATPSTQPTNKTTRVDLEEEEDWSGPPEDFSKSLRSDPRRDEEDEFQSQQTAAKEALENTFRKESHGDRTIQDVARLRSLPVSIPTSPFSKCFWKGIDTAVGKNWRRDNHVTLSASNRGKKGIGCGGASHWTTLDPILLFDELRDVLGAALMQQITVNYTAPTLVQSQTLPVALAGRDAVVTAATGQGKTLAYIWPIAVHVAHQDPLRPGETGPIALVLVPTRELALQVQKQAKPMLAVAAGGKPLKCRAVIGGQAKYMLRQELKHAGVEVVIATPGRLLDVVSDTKGLSLQRVTITVLDEADKMLHMGFESQVRQILQQIRPDRQTLMLSATMGLRVEKVAAEWLQADAVRISIGRTGEASQNVTQHVMVLRNETDKESFLMEMLPVFCQVGRTVVFVATREGCEKLAAAVRERTADVTVLTLHGDKHQSDRTAAVRAFTKGEVTVLIATDVAARGLDIPNIQTVLSFDPAKNLDSHVHRVGRAGRLSKDTNEQQSGAAYTLLTPKNADFAHILRGAFVREGRDISPQLEELAQKSRRAGNVESRTKGNKAGLGFVEEGQNATHQQVSTAKNGSTTDNAAGYCGPSGDTHAPPAKRSRWS
jgi:ATP-dependent RNA helicase DDX42